MYSLNIQTLYLCISWRLSTSDILPTLQGHSHSWAICHPGTSYIDTLSTWVLPNPSLGFPFSFASATLFRWAWINRSANELFLWPVKDAARNFTVCLQLGMLRGTYGPLHWWYSLLNIFKQAQMIFVKKKKKSLILFIIVINYFIHDIYFCLSFYNFKDIALGVLT